MLTWDYTPDIHHGFVLTRSWRFGEPGTARRPLEMTIGKIPSTGKQQPPIYYTFHQIC